MARNAAIARRKLQDRVQAAQFVAKVNEFASAVVTTAEIGVGCALAVSSHRSPHKVVEKEVIGMNLGDGHSGTVPRLVTRSMGSGADSELNQFRAQVAIAKVSFVVT
jgi:hypothetical protein